jgi:formate-dependent nitrite reductase membrane component NrfD
MPPAEHFASPPQWEWWILGYFFFGGIAGGSYALGTLLRFAGDPRDERAARLAFIASFIALIPCPIFLTIDLGQPLLFWHMLVDTSPGGGLAFRPDSPMSLGSWALLAFGLFSFVSFLGAIAEGGRFRATSGIARILRGGVGLVWNAIGTVFGLFICAYTGVLLAVSNQAVWSDAGWALAGMFLASALAGSTALLLLIARSRRDVDADTDVRLETADRYFVILETILIIVFLITLAIAGTIGKVLGVWIVLWLVVIIGLAAPLVMVRAGVARRWPPVAAPLLALLGVLALRALVIFSAQI